MKQEWTEDEYREAARALLAGSDVSYAEKVNIPLASVDSFMAVVQADGVGLVRSKKLLELQCTILYYEALLREARDIVCNPLTLAGRYHRFMKATAYLEEV